MTEKYGMYWWCINRLFVSPLSPFFLPSLSLSSHYFSPTECNLSPISIPLLFVHHSADGWLQRVVILGSEAHVIEEIQLFDRQQPVDSLTISHSKVISVLSSLDKPFSYTVLLPGCEIRRKDTWVNVWAQCQDRIQLKNKQNIQPKTHLHLMI